MLIPGLPFRHAVCGALLLVLASVAPVVAQDPVDRDEARRELTADLAKTDDMRRQTEQGKNLSEMRLGLFAIHLLNEMSRDDAALYGFVHRDDHSATGYLEEIFQYHSAEEMVALDALGADPHRRVARSALETLLHIPNGDEPPEVQAGDRRELAAALARLEAALKAMIEGINAYSIR